MEFDSAISISGCPATMPFWLGPGPKLGSRKSIDEADACVEQGAVAVGAVEGDGALQHVADAIEFVAAGLDVVLHAERLAVVDVIGVEVAARLLGSDDVADHGGGGFAELGWADLEFAARSRRPRPTCRCRSRSRRGLFAGRWICLRDAGSCPCGRERATGRAWWGCWRRDLFCGAGTRSRREW